MPSAPTARGKKKQRQAEIREIARAEGWTLIDPSAWQCLRKRFTHTSESTLRHDVRECGLPLHPLVEGARLDRFEDLERTLLALAEVYAAHVAHRPSETRNPARMLVLDARRKAEYVLRNPRVDEEKRRAMEEKLLWVRTWLENPILFPAWVPLRRQQSTHPHE